MDNLVAYANGSGCGGVYSSETDLFAFNDGGEGGALDLDDCPFAGADDLGNPDRTAWASATRTYLENSDNYDVNVIIWSWCGQADTSEEDIAAYLDLMNGLESDYPHVRFVYMTGHLVGTGTDGNLNQRNEQIRQYCRDNDKWLFDFADIESYDPDGLTNYNILYADDACNYDQDGDGNQDSNWAAAWQNAHTEDTDWYTCDSAHSEPLNANMKAYAAWWLWARLAGWNGE